MPSQITILADLAALAGLFGVLGLFEGRAARIAVAATRWGAPDRAAPAYSAA